MREFREDVLNVLFAMLVIAVCVVVVIAVGAGLMCGATYCVQGCLINKGHIGPHISDGAYTYHITNITYPRADNKTFYVRGLINGREYTIRSDESLGEQAWSTGVNGDITIWSKNNHIIKYHIGAKKAGDK